MSIDATARIHPTAVIEEGATIGADVLVGAFCLVGADVTLAAGSELKSHVVVTGDTVIGEETVIFSFAVVGECPQDLKYRGEKSRLVIGKRNRIREHVTINLGTKGGGNVTRIGDDCLLMAGAHVAHDVQIGNRVILVNSCAIAGHCIIEDEVIVGGMAGIHQWVRVGRGAIIGGITRVPKDVIPYGMVKAANGELDGLNLIGLKRRGVARADITALRAAFQSLAQGEGSFQDRASRLGDTHDSAYVHEVMTFILGTSDRSFMTPS